ncbi:MAG: hypothetical protein RMN51_09295 [Verrucomicrobiota bacterium]|nr:hypothetical protein [Limisphaera sp.]MDW8382286.1 hypothetical protein [Verrucomicrobiota bacterium]
MRNKKRTLYCYSEAERDAAVQALGGSPEITRFKGLGEISPREFAHSIGTDMQLSRVEYASRSETSAILAFYLGRNTLERRDFIMAHLVVSAADEPVCMPTGRRRWPLAPRVGHA